MASQRDVLNNLCLHGDKDATIVSIECPQEHSMNTVIVTRESVARLCGFGSTLSSRYLYDQVQLCRTKLIVVIIVYLLILQSILIFINLHYIPAFAFITVMKYCIIIIMLHILELLSMKNTWVKFQSCQVSWFDQDSPGFVMPVLVLFWLREKY